jgi:hypothetical protein
MKTGLGSAVATIALALLALLTGCDAATPIQPGLAAVRIEVIARPKAGYHPPADSSYGSSASGDDRYVPVDYTRLENVIVWLEPEGQAIASDAAARATRIRLVRPRSRAALPWYVACANAPVILQNANSSPDHFYSVSEGNNFDTGELGSSGEATVVIHAVADREPQRSREDPASVVEVFSTHQEEPVAGIVVAPTAWAASTRSGQAVTFTNLPPGSFRAVCWHPRLPGAEQRIVLPPDKVTRIRVIIGVDSLPGTP